MRRNCPRRLLRGANEICDLKFIKSNGGRVGLVFVLASALPAVAQAPRPKKLFVITDLRGVRGSLDTEP